MKKNVSLILSGGGARGIAHIGVIEELEKQGYNIHSVSGTSMGALVGGVYAVGNMQEFKDWIINLNKLDVFKLIDFTLNHQGFIKGDRVFKEMKRFLPDLNIEDLNINYSATATDLTNKKEVLFTEGSIYNAVRASISIPTVLTPVKHKDSILVDGGVVNNIPVNHARRTKNDILIAVNVNAYIPSIKLDTEKNEHKEEQSFYRENIIKFRTQFQEVFSNKKKDSLSYFNILNKSYEMMREQFVSVYLKKYPPDILIEIPHDSCGVFDFYKASELIRIGQNATIKSLKNSK